MAASHNFSSRYRRLVDRLTARWIGLKSFPVTDLLEVEPRSIGSPELGRQILSGQFVLQGHQVDLQHNALWDLSLSDQAAILDLHGSVWLDHLAAFGAVKAARWRRRGWICGSIASGAAVALDGGPISPVGGFCAGYITA